MMVAQPPRSPPGIRGGSSQGRRQARVERFTGPPPHGPSSEASSSGVPPLPDTCTEECAPVFEAFYAECHPAFDDTAQAEDHAAFLALCQPNGPHAGEGSGGH